MKNLVKVVTVAVLFVGGLVLYGCSSSPSDEEMKQLNDLKAEVTSLETDVHNLESNKADLEKQIAEKNGKLQQCQSDQDAVKKAMGK